MRSEAEYMEKRIRQELVGGTITGAILDRKNGGFGFAVKMPDGTEKAVWVSSDAEGNDCGWLDIQAQPKAVVPENPLHETDRFAVWVARKKIHILSKNTGEEYTWPAKYTDQILSRITSGGVDPTCEYLLPKEKAS